MSMSVTPWDAVWHQRVELGRVLDALARLLARQRQRGRSSAADPVRGLVIEDGEAEGLIAEIGADLVTGEAGGDPVSRATASLLRREIAERADAGASHGAALPLRHVRRAFELTDLEYDAFLLALAVEIDARFGRLAAYLNDHVGRTRPTLGLALLLAGLDEGSAPDAVGLRERPFVRDGLVQLEGEGPLPGLALEIPRAILERVVAGRESSADVAAAVHHAESGLLDRLALDDELRRVIAAWARAKRHDPAAPDLVFGGAEGSGRTTAARAAASELGLSLVAVAVSADTLHERLRLARRESRWHHAAVLLRVSDPGAAAPIDWPSAWSELAGLRVPVFIAGSPAIARQIAATTPRPAVLVEIPPTDTSRRLRIWQSVLGPEAGIDETTLAALAAKFRFTPGNIAHAVARARADAWLEPGGKRRLSVESLERACRSVTSAAVGSLAQKLPLPFRLDDLVMPPDLAAEIALALAWVRQERKVLDDWGFGRRVVLGRSLTALFSGPPGTGKTMAAQVIARELGLDLYRVDLSRIMSKYIGETEKNLAQLFDEAHSSVLFFDEADAIFGKRSEAKDAHDRYANVEIGYLLQRMEEHDGVTVLASNRMTDMDDAFVRRFHVIAHFPMPSEPDRERIWRGMFPPEAALDPVVDLARLARDHELSGGEIKNATLAAAYLAADEGVPIGMAHLTRAIRREIVKAGRVT